MSPYSRRRYLKKAIYLVMAGMVAGSWRDLFAGKKEAPELPPWEELIDYARWCPSVHNLQPYRVKILSAGEAELYYEPARLLPVEDPDAVFMTITMGIFVENLTIAAGKHQTRVEITRVDGPLSTKASGLTKFADLKLVPATSHEPIDRELIRERRTSRLPYYKIPLEERSIEKIRGEAERFGHEMYHSSEKETIDFILNLNREALFRDLEEVAIREELDGLFRYTEKEAEKKKDGLWSKCMNFSGTLIKSVFTHHEKWVKGVRKDLLGKHYLDSFKGTSTICWFSGKFDDTDDWLRAGRMLARNWLLLTREGAYIHPFGTLITNPGAYGRICEKLTNSGGEKKIWMVFRAGYSDLPPRSFRLPKEVFMIS